MNEHRRRRPRRRRGRRGNRGPNKSDSQQHKSRAPEMMVDEEPDAVLESLHSVSELIDLRPAELLEIAQEVGLAEAATELSQQDLIFQILKVSW